MSDDTWFASLVCPVSSERARRDVVRLTAFFVALLAVAYLLTRAAWIPVGLLLDFVARGSGRRAWSPLGRIAQWLVALSRRSSVLIDVAPKQFAARVGGVLSLGMVAAHWAWPVGAVGLAGVLCVFALLESVGNVCVGCLLYTHLVFPLVRRRPPTG